jgi:hypothetical protein
VAFGGNTRGLGEEAKEKNKFGNCWKYEKKIFENLNKGLKVALVRLTREY